MAIASPLNLQQITTGVRSLGVAVTRAQVSANRSAGILVNRNKIKRKLVFGDRLSFDRRRERVRRRRQEDIIESSTIGGFIKNRGLALANSTRGFLGRIMDFLGTLLVGWLLNNLPTIISMAQELMARIGRLVNILGGFVTNIGKSLQSFGKVLGAVGQNIINFDFLDSNKRVQTAMDDLNSVFDDMSTQIDDGLKLFTTPLGEGLVSGEDAAPTGTDYTTQAGAAPAAGTGGVGGSPDFWALAAISSLEDGDSQGRADVAQSIYNRAASGVFGSSSLKALIISGNGGQYEPVGKAVKEFKQIQDRESAIKAVMKAKGVGRSQAEKMINDTVSAITNPALKKKAAEFVENRTDFLGAGLTPTEPSSTPLKRRSSGDNIFGNYVGPGSYEYGKKSQGQAASSNLELPSAAPTPAKVAPAQSRSAVTTSVVDQFKGKPGGSAGIITSERGMRLSPTTGKYRMHHGIDIAPAGRGYFVSLKLSGRVNLVAFDSGGYGNYVDIKSGNIIYRFAHLAKVFVKQGQSYNGETIGEIGSTGGSTGPHLHFEVRPGGGDSINPRPYLGLLSIGKQLTGVAGQPAQIAAPAPAQIAAQPSQRRQQLSSQVTPQRVGQKIVIIDNMQPPQIPSAPPSGGGSMGFIPIQTNSLNSYITKKLLLDLAYT